MVCVEFSFMHVGELPLTDMYKCTIVQICTIIDIILSKLTVECPVGGHKGMKG